MNGLIKRTSGKGLSDMANENGKSSSSKSRMYEVNSGGEQENSISNIPLIKLADNAQLLPKYTAVLNRSGDDGVGMEDLDKLQIDLEKLLSTCAVRNRLLRSDIKSIDKVEERREDKGKPPLKRRKPEEKIKRKPSKSILKRKHVPTKVEEQPKVIVPRSDTSDKFWLSIESYCADVSKDDVAFLDGLIQECSQEVDVKIPEVGNHYAAEWSEKILEDEQNMVNMGKPGKSKSITVHGKNGINSMMDIMASPLKQCLNAIVEEKVMTKFPEVNEKLKPSDLNFLKTSNIPHTNICMELVEQGILGIEDLPKNMPPEDEILPEIEKCQQELATVNKHNVEYLSKLRNIVATDQKRQEVKNALAKVDKQIMEMYKKISMAKQKLAQQDDDGLLPKQKPQVDLAEVENIIKQQVKLNQLHAALSEQTDYSLML